MRSLLLAAVCCLAPHASWALPYKDGVVSVGDRDFFVGDLTQSYGEGSRALNFRHAPWLEILLDNDPVLFSQGVRFLRAGIPASDLVGEVPSQLRENEKLEDDPLYMAEGHDVITFGNLHMDIFPQVSHIKYSVVCTRGLEPGELNICDVRVAYPYGQYVLITARKYFPGQLSEIAANFEPIASRMVEIAICIDVTDQSVSERPTNESHLLEQNPGLFDCRILLSS